jgi:hypothetical protein
MKPRIAAVDEAVALNITYESSEELSRQQFVDCVTYGLRESKRALHLIVRLEAEESLLQQTMPHLYAELQPGAKKVPIR